MAELRNVEVIVKRQTSAVSRAGFSTALLLGTSKNSSFTEYGKSEALAGISADFGANSDEYRAAQRYLSQTPSPNKIYTLGVAYTDDPAVLTAALDALGANNEKYYFLICSNHTVPVVTALSNWTETQKKVYSFTTSKKDWGDTLTNNNSIAWCHDLATSMLGEGFAGRVGPLEPGSYTGTFKQIAGEIPAGYTNTEITAIHDKNCNTYIRQGGVNMTSASKTLSGEYFDVIVTSHYVEARFQEALLNLLVNNDKVPYDYTGTSMVYAAIADAIALFPNGLLATDAAGNRQYLISVPDMATITSDIRASRVFEGTKVTLSLGGAMEGIKMEVTLNYEDLTTAA